MFYATVQYYIHIQSCIASLYRYNIYSSRHLLAIGPAGEYIFFLELHTKVSACYMGKREHELTLLRSASLLVSCPSHPPCPS
jgi:hypothetical protein